LILIGGGEHARVVAEAARSVPGRFELLGFVDPNPSEETTRRLDLPCLGDDSALSRHRRALSVLGLGSTASTRARVEVARRVAGSVAGWATVVHATAWTSPTAVLGAGTVVLAGVVINSGAQVGGHCVLNSGALIEHDAVIEDHAFVAPGAAIGGGAWIGAGAFVGLGAVIRDHVRVGAGALVAMGAAVVEDVPAGAEVRGVPARVIGERR